ncbi:MAG: hypothetical protein P8P81_03265 [Bacteroidia bacterium]|nr:hypothetical protein [Bacteroidia bacterium]
MFKVKSYLYKSKSILILSIFGLLILSKCTTFNNEKIKAIQQLQDTLILNQENLSIDIPLFKYRIEAIEQTLRNYRINYKEPMNQDLGLQLSRFKVLKKIYFKQMGEYDFCSKEQKDLTSQMKNLLSDVKSNRLSKNEFKQYFAQEKKDIFELVIRSEKIKKSLYEIEPEYIKLEKTLLFSSED